MGILKTVVIGMAVLIVIGMGLLVYGLVTRSVNGDDPGGAPQAAAPAPMIPFGEVVVPAGPGCAIADMAADGGRLYVRTGPGADCARIFVLDPATGTVLGTVAVAP